MGNSTALALAVLALALPTGTTPKAAAIFFVITVPLAPVSTIISNRCVPLKVTSIIGVPPIRRLIGAINTSLLPESIANGEGVGLDKDSFDPLTGGTMTVFCGLGTLITTGCG
jgi:hypothetical protein